LLDSYEIEITAQNAVLDACTLKTGVALARFRTFPPKMNITAFRNSYQKMYRKVHFLPRPLEPRNALPSRRPKAGKYGLKRMFVAVPKHSFGTAKNEKTSVKWALGRCYPIFNPSHS
jgi:hypothetical protein